MPNKEYTREQDAGTIEPRLPASHHKPDHMVKPSSPNESQDADRHNKIRHTDSEK